MIDFRSCETFASWSFRLISLYKKLYFAINDTSALFIFRIGGYMNTRFRIEKLFFNLGSWAYRHRSLALLISLTLLFTTLLPLRTLRFESSILQMFHHTDPARITYEEFREQFGKDDNLLILLQADSLFDQTFLKSLHEMHQRLEREVPHLKKITSLVNVRRTYGQDDRLIVEDLMKKVPTSQSDLESLRQNVVLNPLYKNFLISQDAASTVIIIEPKVNRKLHTTSQATKPVDTDEYIEMYAKVRQIVDPYQDRGVVIHYAGQPVLSAVLHDAIQQDLRKLGPLSLGLVMIILALLFRRVTGVIYPLLVILASILSTLGTMAALDLPMTNISSGIPTFLVVIGLADSVHILAVFYKFYQECGDKHTAIAKAFGHSGLPVLLTSLTTAAGLFSFVTADVSWVADFAKIVPIGVFFAFFYTVLLLPALLSLFPISPPKQKTKERSAFWDRNMSKLGNLTTHHPWRMILVWSLLLITSLLGFSKIYLSQNSMKWFPENHPLRVATYEMDRQFKGSVNLEVVIDTGKENGLYDAELMHKMERTIQEFESKQIGSMQLGKAVSVTTVLKEVNQALNGNQPSFYTVADTDELVAQELLLFEMSGSDDLEHWVSTDFRIARMTLTKPFLDAVKYVEALSQIEAHFQENYPDLKIATTGMAMLFTQTIYRVLTSMAKSYPLALIIITLIMIILVGRVKIGLLSMVPNLVPILIIVGWMGLLDIPFDFSTMLIGSISIGLVVDDTIHFLHTFSREHTQKGDVHQAVYATLTTTGRAILITSLTLAAGFFVYTTATLQNFFYFGLLTGTTVLVAMLADFLLVPALMAIVFRNGADQHP